MEETMCNTTIQGLNDWATGMHKKFGWMIMAHHSKRYELIEGYILNLNYLLECIHGKMKRIKNEDHLEELKTLKNSLTILLKFTKEKLKIPSTKKNKKK
jgi:hypothetical protein